MWDIGIQHEVLRGLAVSVSYNQRNFYNIIWTQNLSIPYSQYTPVSIPDPQGNGQTITVFNVNRSVFGLVNELDTNSNVNTRVYKGVDVSVAWRFPGGGTLIGGTSTGRTLTNTCDVEDPNNQRFCDFNQYRLPATNALQAVGHLSPALRRPTERHLPAHTRQRTHRSRTSSRGHRCRRSSRRASPSGSACRLGLQRHSEPDRFHGHEDLRHARYELRPELSVFNLFNANAVTSQTNSFGPALNNAITILPQRMARLGLAVKF